MMLRACLPLSTKTTFFCSPAQGLTSKVSGPGEKVQDKLPGDIVAETVKDGAFDPIRRGSDRPPGDVANLLPFDVPLMIRIKKP